MSQASSFLPDKKKYPHETFPAFCCLLELQSWLQRFRVVPHAHHESMYDSVYVAFCGVAVHVVANARVTIRRLASRSPSVPLLCRAPIPFRKTPRLYFFSLRVYAARIQSMYASGAFRKMPQYHVL